MMEFFSFFPLLMCWMICAVLAVHYRPPQNPLAALGYMVLGPLTLLFIINSDDDEEAGHG